MVADIYLLIQEVDIGQQPKSLTMYSPSIKSLKPNLKSIQPIGAETVGQGDSIIPPTH